jgi:N-acyl-L-homoserine lactone synthetase
MITILTNADRATNPQLFEQMFRGRAAVFHDRLRWEVLVREGLEFDRYDEEEDPVYVVAIDEREVVVGSLRLLPTMGETMLRNEFADFFSDPVDVMTPTAWECTRFCVHPPISIAASYSPQRISSELLVSLCKLAMATGIDQIVGLYEAHMARVYRRIGWSPVPLARSREEVGKLIVGIWDVSQSAIANMRSRAELVGASLNKAA